ncbi:hypothetical protein D3C76_1443570 [compost metagenome]
MLPFRKLPVQLLLISLLRTPDSLLRMAAFGHPQIVADHVNGQPAGIQLLHKSGRMFPGGLRHRAGMNPPQLNSLIACILGKPDQIAKTGQLVPE